MDFTQRELGLDGVEVEIRDAFQCGFDNPWLEKSIVSFQAMQEVERLFSSMPNVMVKMHPRLTHSVDHASADMIHGWVRDWSRPKDGLHVSLRNKSTGEIVVEKPADQFRQDLLDAGFGDGTHGFTIEIPDGFSFRDAQVCLPKYSSFRERRAASRMS